MKFRLAKFGYFGVIFALILVMTYKKIGETAHEILGILLIAFAFYHAFKRAKFLKFQRRNLAHKALNFALLFSFIATFISAVFVSEHIFAFVDFGSGSDAAKNAHMCATHALFLLVAVHISLNFNVVKFRANFSNFIKIPLYLIILALGIYSFYDLHFYEYLFFQTGFGIKNENSLFVSICEYFFVFTSAVILTFVTKTAINFKNILR